MNEGISTAEITGTAEAFYDGLQRIKFGKEPSELLNLSFVGYALYDNPQVAKAIFVPWEYQGGAGTLSK
ncbi:hypothetical protein CUU64_21405 [Bacillus sp. V5-8f]|nr:hypothetical protein CUU64_21405 [Bacillus sp. V5-8f]